MTTDTPRTDAHYATTKTAWPTQEDKDFAKRLERELLAARDANFNLANALSKAEAEITELNILMVGWKQRTGMSEMDLEASKAQVERLKALPHFHHESYCRKCGAPEMTLQP